MSLCGGFCIDVAFEQSASLQAKYPAGDKYAFSKTFIWSCIKLLFT